MEESWRTRLARWGFNLFPAYRGTGGRIAHISANWHEIGIRLPLNWRTRNYVGSIFGGSIYGAVDPIYMIMFIKILGPEYIVWDKAATIRFIKPGRSTLFAHFYLSPDDVQGIRDALKAEPKLERDFQVEVVDERGEIHATVEKTLYFRHRGSLP